MLNNVIYVSIHRSFSFHIVCLFVLCYIILTIIIAMLYCYARITVFHVKSVLNIDNISPVSQYNLRALSSCPIVSRCVSIVYTIFIFFIFFKMFIHFIFPSKLNLVSIRPCVEICCNIYHSCLLNC